MNDAEREKWIRTDDGLAHWLKAWRTRRHKSDRHVHTFIREHRAEIDAIIRDLMAAAYEKERFERWRRADLENTEGGMDDDYL